MYDFSKVARDAAKTASSESSSKEFKYKLVYPGQGKIKFRILFNPKSGLVSRLVTRHNIDGNKVPCASTYTHKDDCPICKVLADIDNMGITYPREYNSKTRALLFAQFVSADYEVAGGNLHKGDVFILMVPYTIYREINKWIADFASDSAIMSRVFGSHEYSVQVIEKGKDGTDWSFRPDPNITIESAKTDEEFSKMLEGLDSLYEILGFHEKITPEEVALMKTTSESLVDAFISNKSAQKGYAPPIAPVEDANPQNYQAPTTVAASAPTPAAQASKPEPPADHPACWGNFVGLEVTDPTMKSHQTRCKYCPLSLECKNASVPF